MKSICVLFSLLIAFIFQLGMLAASAQTNIYLFTGSETNITLNPGTYLITAYGAKGGSGFVNGGLGAEMEAQFTFAGVETLTLLVGGGGGNAVGYGGGGGGSFVVNGSKPLVVAGGGGGDGGSGLISTNGGGGAGPNGGTGGTGGNGGQGGQGGGPYSGGGGGGGLLGNGYGGGGGGGGGFGFSSGGGGGGYSGGGGSGYNGGGGGGGGSIIDSSAITNLAEISGIASPDDSTNGEIIITEVSALTPPALGISNYGSQPAVFFPTATGTNFVLQMTTNLTSGPWVTVSNGVSISGIIVTNPPSNAFFRLH